MLLNQVYLAEQGLCRLCEERQDEGTSGVPLDPAWQEMLNHATGRVNQSEAERGAAGQRHRATAERHRAAQALARQMQASLKRHVTKSRYQTRRIITLLWLDIIRFFLACCY